jgi:AmmeMemoRadiSam system protein B
VRTLFSFICCLLSIFISAQKIRGFADTIGFAHKAKQMDSVIARIGRIQVNELSHYGRNEMPWKAVIAPHDDYTYTGYLYPLALRQVKAKTVILIGVAHKAKRFNLENTMVFEDFAYWNAPYGKVKVSDFRGELISALPKNSFVVHDSCHAVEHSLEAEIPFLQYYNKGFEIIPILIPYMNYDTMTVLSKKLATAISRVMLKHKLVLGKSVAIVISNDAVHYGDQDWGGKNFARFGTDSTGYKNAVGLEQEIIHNCIAGELKPERVKKFTDYTVQKENYKEYNWTWCGRYSVPFGMLTTYYLNATFSNQALKGYYLHYSTSLLNKHIPVSDLGMGVTAVCNLHHWVGYLAAGFR